MSRKKKDDGRFFVRLMEILIAFIIGCFSTGIIGIQYGKDIVRQEAVELEKAEWTDEGEFIWEGSEVPQPEAKWWQFLKRWRE